MVCRFRARRRVVLAADEKIADPPTSSGRIDPTRWNGIGDYKVEREIRHEDIGTTYKGVHLVLPRVAAIKVLDAAHRPLAVQMLREACILEALTHPGAPRVFECGVLSDRRPWVAMELVDGPTMADLCSDGPLAISDLVVAVRTIAEVLEHAHARGVVAPAADRGVRRPDPLAATRRSRSRTGTASVTRDSSSAPDAARDIGALGTLAFRALTGTSYTAGASAHLAAPAAPAELAQLIDDMIEPMARPTATDVRDRATWLAETLEPRRSTQEMGPLPIEDAPSGVFSIRILR